MFYQSFDQSFYVISGIFKNFTVFWPLILFFLLFMIISFICGFFYQWKKAQEKIAEEISSEKVQVRREYLSKKNEYLSHIDGLKNNIRRIEERSNKRKNTLNGLYLMLKQDANPEYAVRILKKAKRKKLF